MDSTSYCLTFLSIFVMLSMPFFYCRYVIYNIII